MKSLKRLTGCFCILILILALSGCGKKDPVKGLWNVSDLKVGEDKYSISEYAEKFGEDVKMTFEFDGEDKVTMEMEGEKYEGTYEIDGKYVDVTFEGETQDLEMEGDTLVFDMGEMAVVFKR